MEFVSPQLPDVSGGSSPRYRKGTLGYTGAGLAMLFFYLLWGDFCMQLMEMVIVAIFPLQLKGLGASNTVIGFLATTLPAIMTFTINPIVSFRSDSFRSAWGRRLPFLMVVTPFVTLFLLLLAFAPEIGGMLGRTDLLARSGMSPTAVILGTFGILMVLFQLLNACMIPVYYYLLVDVVPDEVMGRFMSLFRIVGTLSGYFFHTFIFGHALSYTREIYVGAALLYLFGFGIMCWRVREGQYPPPVHADRLGLAASIRLYCRECYSHPHYLLFNARNAIFSLAGVVGIYSIFVVRDEVGVPLDMVGRVTGWSQLIVAFLLFPLGMLSDRIRPVRVFLLASMFLPVLPLLNFFFLHSQTSYIALTLLGLPLYALMSAAELPMHMSILPRERYGQFGSANQLVCSLTIIVGSIVAGQFMDVVTQGGEFVAGYRYLYLWSFLFQVIALVLMVLLYASWKRHGGPHNYTPPQVGISPNMKASRLTGGEQD